MCLKCGKTGHRTRNCTSQPSASNDAPRQIGFQPSLVLAAMLEKHLPNAQEGMQKGLPCIPHSSLKALEIRTQPFTMLVGCSCDEFAGPKLHLDDFHTSMRTGHALLDLTSAQPHEARTAILHAQECRHEGSLGIVYLLPSVKHTAWKSLLTNAAGLTSVYPRVKQNGKSTRAHALYEGPLIAGLSTLWTCNVAGAQARALYDSGSQLNFVSKRWAEIHGLQTPAHSMPLTLVNGQQASCSSPLQLKLKLQAYHGSMTCHVLDLPEQYDVILGEATADQGYQ